MSPELDPQRIGDHLDRLYRAAWALTGSREDAEDLVQETYARVLAKPRFLRNDDDLGYLLRTLRNTFLTQQRDRSRRIQAAALGDDVAERLEDPVAPRPDVILETRDVYAAVAALPDEYRDAIIAVDVAGLSYKEAARALGTKEGTIMSRLFRGRQRVIRAVEGP
jgi:RNA polymerase sigma-70 factor, ECF subfamily